MKKNDFKKKFKNINKIIKNYNKNFKEYNSYLKINLKNSKLIQSK